jgi:WD40 repeat protein
MAENEEGATQTLTNHRKVMDSLIDAHKGRIANTAGDSVLAEFPSPVEAMKCAIEIQEVLRARNARLPEQRRMQFRIGVNLGDVIVKDGDLLGDGVNVAARLQALAEPGGICFTGSVHDQIEGKLDLSFISMGEQTVKNIPRPIRIYKIGEFGVPQAEARSTSIGVKVIATARRPLLRVGLPAAIAVAISALAVLWFWSKVNNYGAPGQGHLEKTIGSNLLTINALAFSPDGKFLVSGGADTAIRVWDVATGKEVRTLVGHTDEVNGFAFSPDGMLLTSASDDKTIRIWDFDRGTTIRVLSGHTAPVTSVVFSPDGRDVLSGSEDTTVKIWSVDTGTKEQTLRGHSGFVLAVAISPDGRLLLSGGRDKTIKLWDVASGRALHNYVGHGDYVTSVAFSRDGRYVVSASEDESVKLWDSATAAAIRSFNCGNTGCFDASISPDGQRIISLSDDSVVRSWNASTGKELSAFRAGNSAITSFALSSDGRFAASSADDKVISLWRMEN